MTPEQPQDPSPQERSAAGRSLPRPLAAGAGERIATIIEAAERAASAVVDSADANARRYLAEAEAEADRVVAERLSTLQELTDSILAQAEEVRRQSERLLEFLARANAQIELSGGAPGAPAQPSSQGAEGQPAAAETGPRLATVAPPPAPQPQTAVPAAPAAPAAAPQPPPEPEPEPPAAPEPEPRAAAAEPVTARPAAPAEDQSAGARLLATQMAVSGSSREEIEAHLRSGFEIEDPTPILDAILGPEG